MSLLKRKERKFKITLCLVDEPFGSTVPKYYFIPYTLNSDYIAKIINLSTIIKSSIYYD
jgi:hypothetical protein